MKTEVIALLSFVFLSALTGCFGRQPDKRLLRVDELASVSPEDALDSLCAIDYAGLPEADRHYYDLLSIKAADKAYKTHTSDSLVLDVIDYYSSHGKDDLYAEALYYGGRVYNDLGDYPTSLNYFRQALDEIPDGDEHLYFKGVVLSQTGRLLHALRLYSQAASYVEEAVRIDKLTADTSGMAFDLDLLCHIYINSSDISKAAVCNAEAIKLAAALPIGDRVGMLVSRASIQYENGEIDSALQTIRPLYSKVDSMTRNYMLSVASKIYHAAGILDTAYVYAYELAMSPNWNNRKNGFKILVSPKMRGVIPQDSILSFMPEYHRTIEEYLETHEAQAALIQNANYNYQLHVRERQKAEASKLEVERIAFCIILIVLMIFIWLLYMKYRDSKEILRLRKALDLLESLPSGRNEAAIVSPPSYEADSIRGSLLAKVQSFDEDADSGGAVPDIIVQSKPYNVILNKLDGPNKVVPSETWNDLAAVVEEAAPGFLQRLEDLTGGKLSQSNLRMVLLIRCGFTPTDMSTLLCKAKGTISSNRRYLGKKIFGQTISGQLFDKVIRIL